jgi:hypothetical protein
MNEEQLKMSFPTLMLKPFDMLPGDLLLHSDSTGIDIATIALVVSIDVTAGKVTIVYSNPAWRVVTYYPTQTGNCVQPSLKYVIRDGTTYKSRDYYHCVMSCTP